MASQAYRTREDVRKCPEISMLSAHRDPGCVRRGSLEMLQGRFELQQMGFGDPPRSYSQDDDTTLRVSQAAATGNSFSA